MIETMCPSRVKLANTFPFSALNQMRSQNLVEANEEKLPQNRSQPKDLKDHLKIIGIG
jgi:hypothetical protein